MSRKELPLSVCKCNQKSETASVYARKFPFRRPENAVYCRKFYFRDVKSGIYGGKLYFSDSGNQIYASKLHFYLHLRAITDKYPYL